MARKPKKGQAAAASQAGAPRPQQQGTWGPLRDAIRRDVEQSVSALAFAQRLHDRLDTQRRLFHDFPRSLEQLRSGALERLAAALSRLYEGGQGFDLQRFLRDLPLAAAQLALAERKLASQPPPAADPPGANGGGAQRAAQPAEAQSAPAEAEAPAAEPSPAAPEGAAPEVAAPAAPEQTQPVSPRMELRAKMLNAAPQLARAAQSYRRNVGTIRRAALPRRSQGPWRTDREVLEEGHRAVEFVQKLYDTYAEAWADQPLPTNLYVESAAETDRFLAWTQMDRYAELALLASTGQPRAPKPGQHVIAPEKPEAVPTPPVTEASPGAVVAAPEPGPAGGEEEREIETPIAQEAASESGRA